MSIDEEYINILNCIVELLDVRFKHTRTTVIEQNSNTFVVDIDTVYEDKTDDVYMLIDLVYAIGGIFEDYPLTDTDALTGTDDVMHSLYIYPSDDLGHHIPLHTRIYAEIRFMLINPEIFIRIHITIPQYDKNLKLIRDELYTKIFHPKYYKNFTNLDTLENFKEEE